MNNRFKNKAVRKIALVAVLTAFATVLSFIRIPVISTATLNLVLPVIVVGSILCGPYVGALITVIPAIAAFGEAAIFMEYSPIGTVLTLILKGLFTGFVAGWFYKLFYKKHPTGAVFGAAISAPIVNSGVFLLGCYIFLWDKLVSMAAENSVGIGLLLFGLVGMNFILELILNIVLAPVVKRVVQIALKKKIVSFDSEE